METMTTISMSLNRGSESALQPQLHGEAIQEGGVQGIGLGGFCVSV